LVVIYNLDYFGKIKIIVKLGICPFIIDSFSSELNSFIFSLSLISISPVVLPVDTK